MTAAESVPARVALARLLSRIERQDDVALDEPTVDGWVIGVTGPPGAGKSTLVSALVSSYRAQGERVAVLAVDPSSPYSGGAVLGDRLRMITHVGDDGVFIRSLASRGQLGGLAAAVPLAVRGCLAHGYPRVIVETVGVGQGEVDIARHADTTVLVTAPGLGDSVQAEKAGVLEVADVLVVNKCDRPGARDLERDLTAMVRLTATPARTWRVPVVTTRADTGEGVGDVRQAVEDHRSHVGSHDGIESRRARRRVDEWRALCERRVAARLSAGLASALGESLAADVLAGRRGIAESADALVAELFRQ